MSKNFELLQRAQREQELSRTPKGSARSDNGAHPGPRREALLGEEAVKLVQRVFLVPGPDAPRAVVFTGVEHGDGCTTVCACAAETLAFQVAGSFCVVDGNLRAPSLHRYFGVDNGMGLAEAVTQSGPIRSFTQQVEGSNLWVLTCGSDISNVPSLLNSDGLRSRLADLRAEFDHVLIDTPPVNLYADAVALGKLSDGVILVLQSNSTRREAAREVKESLEVAHVRLLGAVLNRRTFPVPPILYGRL